MDLHKYVRKEINKYLVDFDFIKLYQRLLAKRLLDKNYLNIEADKNLLYKLGIEFGEQNTKKAN